MGVVCCLSVCVDVIDRLWLMNVEWMCGHGRGEDDLDVWLVHWMIRWVQSLKIICEKLV
jgi:hypothetical protein